MRLLVVGAGGHAKVVLDAALEAGIEVVGVVGDPQGREQLLGIPIAESFESFDADFFIIAVGDNRTRSELFSDYIARGMEPAAVIHPSAILGRNVEVGAGTFVAAGVVINLDTRVGADAILNTGCSVDHDCRIGDHAHVGPMSGVCGGVRVGAGALLGVGTSIVPLQTVGDWAVVGAGSAVLTDVPDGETYAGVPARAIRTPRE